MDGWAIQDSNLGPLPYQARSGHLAVVSVAPSSRKWLQIGPSAESEPTGTEIESWAADEDSVVRKRAAAPSGPRLQRSIGRRGGPLMQRVAGKATLVAKLDDSLDQIPNKSIHPDDRNRAS